MKKNKRKTGILLHPSSLPSLDGIGNIGGASIKFLQQLKQAGQSVWQMLPIGPTDTVGSPYASTSTFAGNVLLIDVTAFNSQQEIPKAPAVDQRVSRRDIIRYKLSCLKHSFSQLDATANETSAFAAFKVTEAEWLDDFVLFQTLADHFGTTHWPTWPSDIAHREAGALNVARQQFASEIEFCCYCQFIYQEQWKYLKSHAEEQGIELIGDIPIYVGYESADVWANVDLFDIDPKTLKITSYAGVPADQFFDSGAQCWGMPTYNWERHAANGYQWWSRRLARLGKLFDIMRLDHFRGLESYWSIANPNRPDAGQWQPGPGQEFFDEIYAKQGNVKLIAEDIGIITPEVDKLRINNYLPGIRVLQFGFGCDLTPNNHLPNCIPPSSVVYTGTHDTDTTLGWYLKLPDEKKRIFIEAAAGSAAMGAIEPSWALIALAMNTAADTVIVPMQDILSLGSEGRMNIPGACLPENWSWQMTSDWDQELIQKLKRYTLCDEPSSTSMTSLHKIKENYDS